MCLTIDVITNYTYPQHTPLEWAIYLVLYLITLNIIPAWRKAHIEAHGTGSHPNMAATTWMGKSSVFLADIIHFIRIEIE